MNAVEEFEKALADKVQVAKAHRLWMEGRARQIMADNPGMPFAKALDRASCDPFNAELAKAQREAGDRQMYKRMYGEEALAKLDARPVLSDEYLKAYVPHENSDSVLSQGGSAANESQGQTLANPRRTADELEPNEDDLRKEAEQIKTQGQQMIRT